MASQISPGVVLRERDLSNAVIVNTSSITGAFASTFQKGPIGEVVQIASQKDLLTVFGKPSDAPQHLEGGANAVLVEEILRLVDRLRDGHSPWRHRHGFVSVGNHIAYISPNYLGLSHRLSH